MRRIAERILTLDEDAFEPEEKELKPVRRQEINPAENAAGDVVKPSEEDI